MADGSQKAIEEIHPGDLVRSWGGRDVGMTTGTVTKTFVTPGAEDTEVMLVTLMLDTGELLSVTERHRFLLASGEWAEARHLAGEILMSGSKVQSLMIRELTETTIFNFRVDPQHTYVAGGQVVHNWKARGGVRRASKATREVFGEGGPETAIFVPDAMRQPGKQGEEERVVETMVRVLAKLSGRKVEDFAVKLAEGGFVTKPTLAMVGERGPEAVIPLPKTPTPRPQRSETPGGGSGEVTVVNVFREKDMEAMMAAAVARGSRVVVNDIIQGMAGNRAIRRTIQRTS
jgi:hypothetical protein